MPSAEQTPATGTAPVFSYEEVCITPLLEQRTPRVPRLKAEISALHELAGLLAADTQEMLNSLLALALDLCEADSAGISLREQEPGEEPRFRWIATAGEYSGFVGGGTPFEFSPCGSTVLSQMPQLFMLPERHFTYFYEAGAKPMEEALLIPWNAAGHQQGTLWVVTHNPERHFDAEDVRILTGLAHFVGAAIQSRVTAGVLLEREREANDFVVARELAHHINNPLQSATLALDLMSMPDTSRRIQQDMLPIAREQVSRVAHFVQEILRLKKLPTPPNVV